jgi:hypothetical protein
MEALPGASFCWSLDSCDSPVFHPRVDLQPSIQLFSRSLWQSKQTTMTAGPVFQWDRVWEMGFLQFHVAHFHVRVKTGENPRRWQSTPMVKKNPQSANPQPPFLSWFLSFPCGWRRQWRLGWRGCGRRRAQRGGRGGRRGGGAVPATASEEEDGAWCSRRGEPQGVGATTTPPSPASAAAPPLRSRHRPRVRAPSRRLRSWSARSGAWPSVSSVLLDDRFCNVIFSQTSSPPHLLSLPPTLWFLIAIIDVIS